MRETPFKQVITGLNANGKSVVTASGPTPIVELGPSADRLEDMSWEANIWVARHDSEHVFAEYESEEPVGDELPPASAVFRVVNIPANSGFDLHKTETLDFVVVLSGEVWLTLEEGEVHLAANDCVVTTGVLHGWENRSSAPCLVCGVLLSTTPPESW